MSARIGQDLSIKRNGIPKKDTCSYRLHGEEKEVTRGTAAASLYRPPGRCLRIVGSYHLRPS